MMKKRVQSCSLVSVLVLMVTVMFPGASAAQITQVVGGTPVSPSDYPYFVDVSGCGGTVAAPGWVLTAAHCVAGGPASALRVSRPGSDMAYTPAHVYIHPLWNGDHWDGHDIALLAMWSDAAAVLTHAIQIGSPWNAGFYAPGVEATLIGTGVTSPDGARPGSLMLAEILLRSDAYMHDVFDPWKDALMIGAGSASATSCFGDSGGPLFVHVNGTPVQVGIVSGGTGDCSAAALYTELAGPTLAWVAHIAPAIMRNWPVCYDHYGQPGRPSATYTYQPWLHPNDGDYFGAITCQLALPPPPPPPPTVEFTGMGSGTKPTTAMANATSDANRKASNAGYTSCEGVDSSVEYDPEFGEYVATVTVGCTQ